MVTTASEWVGVRERDGGFERLFEAEYARVVSIAWRVLRDADAAEDVAQDVFCSFIRAHHPDAPYARGWLYRAAVHTALNVVRGNKRRERRETVSARGARPEVHGTPSPDPALYVEREEGAAAVRRALSRLPEKQASILALRYSDLSYAEVAAVLGVGVGQVGTLLRRAEAALKKEMTRETSI